jgi:pyruvyltransferase
VLLNDQTVPVRWWAHADNFGDLLAPWLVNKITGKEVSLAKPADPHYLVVGSILGRARPSSVVWGIGAFGTERLDTLCPTAEYLAVRGPLTRNKLATAKIKCPRIYGDPALLAPRYWAPRVSATHEVGLVLRWSEYNLEERFKIPGVKKIYLRSNDVEGTIDAMCSCKNILSSSLHGLIIADAYGIPNAWLATRTPRGLEFKYWDYFISVKKLRDPLEYNLLQSGLTCKKLREDINFDRRPIEIDLDLLMRACPFT